MHLTLVFTLLAVVVGSNASVARAPANRANLYLGYIAPGDKLLTRQYLYQPAIINTVQYQDVVYRGNATTIISAIQAQEQGFTQFAYPQLLSGGIGRNNATIRIQSARGYGYNYRIEIYGR